MEKLIKALSWIALDEEKWKEILSKPDDIEVDKLVSDFNSALTVKFQNDTVFEPMRKEYINSQYGRLKSELVTKAKKNFTLDKIDFDKASVEDILSEIKKSSGTPSNEVVTKLENEKIQLATELESERAARQRDEVNFKEQLTSFKKENKIRDIVKRFDTVGVKSASELYVLENLRLKYDVIYDEAHDSLEIKHKGGSSVTNSNSTKTLGIDEVIKAELETGELLKIVNSGNNQQIQQPQPPSGNGDNGNKNIRQINSRAVANAKQFTK